MRDYLAEKLLVKIMKWSPEEISKERPLLQALSSFKYNEYQQFSTGIRFIESLVRWLSQFNEISERKIAYDFILKNLIFISNEQMAYLVSIAFNDKINPVIINKTANELNIGKHFVLRIINSKEYEDNLRKSLFIGLSDGSRIDYLRRNSNINNEQVSTTYDLSDDKINDLLSELMASQSPLSKFETVFLVDDFTASGKSYFRPEESKGKIWKFLDKVYHQNNLENLIDIEKLNIQILFYLATKSALDNIQSNINDWKRSNQIKTEINVLAIQILEDEIKENVLQNVQFMDIANKYFDDTVVDRHYKKGKHDKPYLGFNECSLPLILSHNTPNNSLPILWLPDDKKYIGLFPRVTRHK